MLIVKFGGLAALLCAAGAASAAPSVEIKDAAATVTVIPENRSDIEVTMAQTNRSLPLTITRDGDVVRIDGGLRLQPKICHGALGVQRVSVIGLGDFSRASLPVVVVRTPMDARVAAGGAVFGAVSRSGSLTLSNSGCGDWTAANVAGPLVVHVAGSGDLHAGEAASADVAISGSANVLTRDVRGGVRARISGSGDLGVAAVVGPLDARVVGSGDVTVHGGEVTAMTVAIAGSGDVRFDGVAQSLNASITGSGDVTVRKVLGSVSRRVAGSGDIRVGT